MNKIYPFKFLDSYSKEDTGLFFGRDEEIRDLYQMVFEANILMVYGASGTGKTSLIQCGLASKFQPHDWLALYVRRGSDLNESFDRVITEAGGVAGSADLAASFKAIYRSSFRPVYLIFDQFEELFILGTKEEEAKFIQTVKGILNIEQPVKMIFSVREEYVGNLYEFEKAIPQLMRKKLRVEPMNLDKVRQVIEGVTTLEGSNISLKQGEEQVITEAIFAKIKGEKARTIQLPYLQVFLDKLYMNTTHDGARQADAVFTTDTINKMGDIGDILRDFLEEQVKAISRKLSTDTRQVTVDNIWDILSPFATLEGTKDPISMQALLERLPGKDTEMVKATVKAFVDGRILRHSEEGDIYELAHDSLAGKIAGKRTDEEVALLEVERLIKSQLALKAEARGLLQANQLNIIQLYWPQLEPRLNEDAKILIDNSRKKIEEDKRKEQAEAERERLEQERKLRLTRRLYVASVVVAILLSVLTFWALRQSKIAKRTTIKSQSMALASQSNLFLLKYNDITKAFRYAMYAYQKDTDDADAIAALYATVFKDASKMDLSFYKHSLQHGAHVTSIVSSADGKRILTASEDNTAVIWDAATGKLIMRFVGHLGTVNLAVFSPNERQVLTASEYGNARIWDVATGKALVIIKASNGGIQSASFSHNGKWVLTGSRADDTVKIWDAITGRQIMALTGHRHGIYSAAFSPDDKQILTAAGDSTARLWDAGTGKTVQVFAGHNGKVWSAVFAPYGNEVFTASQDKTARRWNAANGTLISSYIGHTATVYTIAFSPTAREILTTSDDYTARQWNIDTGIVHVLKAHTDEVMSAVFSPDGKQMLTASLDHTAKIWDAATGTEIATLAGHTNSLNCAVYSRDGSYIMTASSDYTAKVWDTMTMIRSHTFVKLPAGVNSAAFSYSGKQIVTASCDSTIRILNIADGKVTFQVKENDTVSSVVFSPGDDRVLVACGNDAHIWDVASKQKLTALKGHTGIIYSAVYSADGKRVATASGDSTYAIWDAVTGALIKKERVAKGVVFSVAFSPKGDDLLTACGDRDNTSAMINIATDKFYDTFREHTNMVMSAIFSHDGNRCLTASLDNTAKVRGYMPVTMTGHTSGVLDAEFSPDDSLVLTASLDYTAKLWTAIRGKELATLSEHNGVVNTAVFSPDGKWIMTASQDSTVKLWPVDINRIIEETSSKTDDLTNDEKDKYGIPHKEGNK